MWADCSSCNMIATAILKNLPHDWHEQQASKFYLNSFKKPIHCDFLWFILFMIFESRMRMTISFLHDHFLKFLTSYRSWLLCKDRKVYLRVDRRQLLGSSPSLLVSIGTRVMTMRSLLNWLRYIVAPSLQPQG